MSVGMLTRRMIELGASPEVIELVLEYVTRASADGLRMSQDASADARRAKDRERQRGRRKMLKEQRAQANDGASVVTGPSADASADGAERRCDLSSSFSFLKGTSKKVKKARSEDARARGTRIERGAPLSDADRAAAIELGADPRHVDDMWAEFVDYWIGIPGQRGTKLDWSATWRNRVRAIVAKGNGNGNKPNHNGSSQASRSNATGQDAILAGMGRIAARVAERVASERRERDKQADGDAAGEDDDRLI